MGSRALFVASAWLMLVGGAQVPSQVLAAPRVPQVPVLGGGLQSYLDSQGELIHVESEQNAIQRWGSNVNNNPTFTVQIEIRIKTPDVALGIYNAGDAAPALYEIFPTVSGPGWFGVASFRSAPTRVVMNLFDDQAVFRGTTTYLGANRNDFGYYLSGPGGTFYSQDSRNPGGSPQLLVFAGTGLNDGAWWLAFEDASLSGGGSDQDFDDTVLYIDYTPVCPCPVQKCDWSTLKSRFR